MTIKILVTTDGSPRSRSVIPHAAQVARATNGELFLVRVLSPTLDCGDVRTPTLGEAVSIVAEQWAGDLAAEVARLKVSGSGFVEVRRRGEDIHEAILRVAADQGVDLVAMSSRGSGQVRRAILGSVALGVLGKTPTPVVVAGNCVAEPARRRKYHIVVTTDGSNDAMRAVEAVVPLSMHESVKVTLLRIHVRRSRDRSDAIKAAMAADALDRLRDRFPNPAAVRTVVRTVPNVASVGTAILNAASELGASAIAMSTHGHSAKYHVLMGSTALGVLKRSLLPLLLVRSAPAATS